MFTARPQQHDIDLLAHDIARHDRLAIARALNLVDDTRPGPRETSAALFRELNSLGLYERGHIVGLTGPPGAGKSTLASALIGRWIEQGLSVGVLAVDPSSQVSGGALLGDRLRMLNSDRDSVFIRSLSSRGEHGGLSPEALPMSRILLAGFDRVLLETVGIGQSEIDISRHADTTVLLMQPQSGDTVQFIKAGVMEIPDLVVVGKSDLGDAALQMVRELRQVLPARADGTRPDVLPVSAFRMSGVSELMDAIDAHRTKLVNAGLLGKNRRRNEVDWVLRRLKDEFGTTGLAQLGDPDVLRRDWEQLDVSPFERLEHQRRQLNETYFTNSQP